MRGLIDGGLREHKPNPFLKWVGGKFHLAQVIAPYLSTANRGTYFEPFVGGGAVFFSVRPPRSVISDVNQELVNTYQWVKKAPIRLRSQIELFAQEHSEVNYYEIREQFNENASPSIKQAARFVYLNKAGFNGIFRVNKNGNYNVPSGKRAKVVSPSEMELAKASQVLKNAEILIADFEIVLGMAARNDTIYMDPPYPPLSESAFFTHYTQSGFCSIDQARVASVANDLRAKGCNVVVSNADTLAIRQLYKGWHALQVDVRRWVSPVGKKLFAKEILLSSRRP